MTIRPERLEDVVAVILNIFFVNSRLRIARKLPRNVIVVGGGEGFLERVQAGEVIRESRKEENESKRKFVRDGASRVTITLATSDRCETEIPTKMPMRCISNVYVLCGYTHKGIASPYLVADQREI
ncbi:hypothetical protein ALC53_06881 [Atta colombica]|uniref:Uncharacterized protein n=1 Tax=Atta colombica TaxID=520822 RepID=A0A195BDR2_9HYME|nr:hypothetical protein ALC53_06881 [Atta colombica]